MVRTLCGFFQPFLPLEKPRSRSAFRDVVGVGSIIATNCSIRTLQGRFSNYLERFHRPYVQTYGSSYDTRPGWSTAVFIWCVTGIYRRKSSNELCHEGQPQRSGPPTGVVVRPCVYIDTEEAVILHRNGWADHTSEARSRAMRVDTSQESNPFVIRLPQCLPTPSRTLEPVAALHDCASHNWEFWGNGGSGALPAVLHEGGTTPLEGGRFFVREFTTGFPPRAG